MLKILQDFRELLLNNKIKIQNPKLINVIKDYSLHYISEIINIDQTIQKNIEESEAILVNNFKQDENNDEYLIIGFKKNNNIY